MTEPNMKLSLYYQNRDFWRTWESRTEWKVTLENFDLKEFRQNLRDTIAWCYTRIDSDSPETCLRSSELNPPSTDPRYPNYVRMSQATFVELVKKRRRLAREQHGPYRDPVYSGHLLFYYGTVNLHEGAVEAESKGYLAGDQPPWDTFVYRVTTDSSESADYICWLPSEFFTLVSDALWAQSAGWLGIVESSEPPLIPE